MRQMFRAESYHTELLAASLTDLNQLVLLAGAGIEGATLKPSLFTKFLENEGLTDAATDEFNKYWQQKKPPLYGALT
jgi:hypothetical protein